jgi:hypothetical protein
LLEFGLLDQVEAAIAAAPREVQVAWEFSDEVKRDDPGVVALATTLGIADQLPALFARAAQI